MSQFAITSLCYGVYYFQHDDFNDMQHNLFNINFTAFPLPNGQISSSLVVIQAVGVRGPPYLKPIPLLSLLYPSLI